MWGRAKEIQKAQQTQDGKCPVEAVPELKAVLDVIHKDFLGQKRKLGVGSTIFAVKPGDGSAREQAADPARRFGGWKHCKRTTKRYRLINWGMLPFLIQEGQLPFKNGDYLFFPEIRKQ